MHVAALAAPTMPLEWWKWILLEQQRSNSSLRSSSQATTTEAVGSSELWKRQTDQGQTVVELFFRTALNPLPWCKQSLREKAERLKAAMERILAEKSKAIPLAAGGKTVTRNRLTERNIPTEEGDAHDGMIEKLRQLILAHVNGNERENNDIFNNNDNHGPQNEDDVEVVFWFWKKLTALLLCCIQHRQNDSRFSFVDVLAGLPWCPELVGRLAVALFPLQSLSSSPLPREQQPRVLPLHKCVRSLEGVGGASPPRGMIHVLCEAHPSAAAVADPASQGRLPLHVALASGQHPWEGSLNHLFEAYPSCVATPDPVTELPAFCLPGDFLAPKREDRSMATAKALGNRSLCWYYLSKRERSIALEEASVVLDCQQLTAMYEVLRRDPSVLVPPAAIAHR
jgi:hypothetical protein